LGLPFAERTALTAAAFVFFQNSLLGMPEYPTIKPYQRTSSRHGFFAPVSLSCGHNPGVFSIGHYGSCHVGEAQPTKLSDAQLSGLTRSFSRLSLTWAKFTRA
jgi:hypothetical protein